MNDILSRRPFGPRDPEEPNRAATPLELLFDLVSVIAIAAAAAGLHHAIAEGHTFDGLLTYIWAFFAIWWAWMNYSWYASSYDNDDPFFRLNTFFIMTGSLVMAAGIPSIFATGDTVLLVGGFVIMRAGQVIFWLRAARFDPDHRSAAKAYAIGITLCQVYWVAALQGFAPNTQMSVITVMLLGICLELLVPAIAERRVHTPWHCHHMTERYGLLMIIVLGELLLAGSMAIETAREITDAPGALIVVGLVGLSITFAMWWIYFSWQIPLAREPRSRAFLWGYGHYFIYASGAAVGAGLAATIDVVTGRAEISLHSATGTTGVAIALYLMGIWVIRDRLHFSGPAKFVIPIFAALIGVAGFTMPYPIEAVAVLLVLCVFLRHQAVRRAWIGASSSAL